MTDAKNSRPAIRDVRLSQNAIDAINSFGSHSAQRVVSRMMQEIPRTISVGSTKEEHLLPTYGELLNYAQHAKDEEKPILTQAIEHAGNHQYAFLEKVFHGQAADQLLTDLRRELSVIPGYKVTAARHV